MNNQQDIKILRELAKQLAGVAADPVQEQRRQLWTRHNSLEKTTVPIFILTGFWDLWCRQAFGDDTLKCADPFFREYERQFRLQLFRSTWGDDAVFEPWVGVSAVQKRGWGNPWGVEIKHESLGVEGSAWHFDPVLKDWADAKKLSWPKHEIDEAATARNVQKLGEAIGDIMTIDRYRGPVCVGFLSDLSTHLTQMRGLEQIMMDMLDEPDELHRILGWMRDGVLANQQAAEDAGDLSTTSQQNQCVSYSQTTRPPQANSQGARRKDLWAFCAAQEFTGISPAMHEEFLIRYQKPIIEAWGLSAYGCCEDLTNKIDMLRQIRNLRIIAVAPRADLGRCAEQIGTDYVMSWRPNPASMVSSGFDEKQIRKILKEELAKARGCRVHINLKDVYTLEGDLSRLGRWVKIAREVVEEF